MKTHKQIIKSIKGLTTSSTKVHEMQTTPHNTALFELMFFSCFNGIWVGYMLDAERSWSHIHDMVFNPWDGVVWGSLKQWMIPTLTEKE